jgi:serine/threonine-protein kinase
VVVGLLALGLVGGVFGSSMFADRSSPGVSTVQDLTPPLPPSPVKTVEAVKPVEPAKTAEVPPPVASPDAEPEKKAEQKMAPAGFGLLLVRAVPFAEVFVDGKLSGEVQGSTGKFRLAAGPHKVKLHHPKRDAEQTVMIKAGAEQLVEFNALSHE